MLEIRSTSGYKEDIACAMAPREEQGLRGEVECKEGLELYGMLEGGMGLKGCLNGRMDAATKLKFQNSRRGYRFAGTLATIQKRRRTSRIIVNMHVRPETRAKTAFMQRAIYYGDWIS